MTLRSTQTTVTFTRPFSLRGVDGIKPAGTYRVDTEEELIEGLSFTAYRRVATSIFLPSRPGGTVYGQFAVIEPHDLEAAQHRDAARS